MNEKALIKRCQRGDRQAFDELIRLYYDYVSGFLRKATENETLCEDLTQETFLKMIRSIERFDPGGSASFGTWLITIARNCYIDQLRRNRIRLEDIDSIQLEDAQNVANEVERRLQYEQIMSGHGNASAGAGAGHPAEICGGHDPCADRRALRRTAQNHQKPHPRRYGKAAEKTQGKERISMDPNVDRIISNLTPAIEQKCGELRRARKERLQSRLFVLLCAMVALIPALLVFVGVSLTVLIAPLAFMALSVLFLLPVLLSGKAANQGGVVYEQA